MERKQFPYVNALCTITMIAVMILYFFEKLNHFEYFVFIAIIMIIARQETDRNSMKEIVQRIRQLKEDDESDEQFIRAISCALTDVDTSSMADLKKIYGEKLALALFHYQQTTDAIKRLQQKGGCNVKSLITSAQIDLIDRLLSIKKEQ